MSTQDPRKRGDKQQSARRCRQVLQDRRSECGTLDRLLEGLRVGRSGALVMRGEPGIGKSALLEYLTEQASGCRVARAAGVESEMELAFAGLHQLCAPMLDRRERLPAPQRDALGVVFGLSGGEAPDRFVVALAVLSLLSDVAQERPLVCRIDDAQWLDRESAQALAFVARRLVAESVVMVFAAREPASELAGLPELVVEGLPGADARALLGTAIRGPLDARVRDRIVAETRGNPLALLELPRGASAAELAGGFGLPSALPLSSRIEESFRRRLEALPADSQQLLLLAAADPIGDPVLVWRAAERLGIGPRHRRLQRRPACSSSVPGRCGSVIRWCAPLSTGPRGLRTGNVCIARWRRRPTPSLIPITAPGTARRRRPDPTRRSLRNWSGRRVERGHVGVLPRRPRSWKSAADLTREPARRASTGVGRSRRQASGGCFRRGAGTPRDCGGGAARRAPECAGGAAARPDRVRRQPRQRRSAAAAQRRQPARAARRHAGARDLPRRLSAACSPAVSAVAAVFCRLPRRRVPRIRPSSPRARPICCSMDWRCCSRRATPQAPSR